MVVAAKVAPWLSRYEPSFVGIDYVERRAYGVTQCSE